MEIISTAEFLDRLIEGSTGKTRDGSNVVNIRLGDNTKRPIIGFLNGILTEWKEDGKFRADGEEHRMDIVVVTNPPTKIEKLIMNSEYSYDFISEIFANDNFQETNYGESLIGELFIVFKNDEDLMYSFVFTAQTDKGSYYKLVYKG